MENRCRFVIAAAWAKREGGGMSEILELVLEFVLNLAGCALEAGDFTGSDSRGSRIFWGIVIVVLGVVIWWELR
jgi:hypothetical protein